jgi:HK97 family phage portal protein
MGSSLKDPLRRLLNQAPVSFAPPGARRGIGASLLGRPAGMEAQMRAQGSSGVLYAIVDRIITSYSQVEWKLYRKATSGLEADRTEVTSHAALDLWNNPNPFMTGPAFRETTQQHEELTGEQWWLPARNPNATIPLELWPVRPDRMEPVPDPELFISGYRYRSPGGEQVPLGLDDVIFQRRPNPLDPYRGLGPVQTVLLDLDAARYGVEWNRNFFLNSAEPGGIIEVDKHLTDDEFDEARERWFEQHRGVSAAHRVAIIENGLKWVGNKFSQRDMQFVELSQVSDEKVRTAFGFPKPMLGSTDDVNRANADAAELVFGRWLLVPRLERTKAALNTRLLPMYGSLGLGYEFDYVSPVPADLEAEAAQLTSKATALRDLVTAGVYGPDAATAVGLPVMDFGAPDSDPNRELLIRLVSGAPSLAPLILPMLGFDLPATPAAPGAPAVPAALARPSFESQAARLLAGMEQPQDAMRWVAVAKDDDDTCQPCKDNDGHLYRNRQDAYDDYPGGSGYVNCIGAEYGNECRCKVVKRGGKGGDDDAE